jgi:hypothetical protein
MVTVKEKQAELDARIAAVMALGKVDCPKCSAPYMHTRFYRPYFICQSCGHRWSINPVTDAWGKFLEEIHQHHPWDWFVTLTFARGEITPFGAQHMFKRYLREIGQAGAAEPYAFRADEYGPRTGRLHLHALIGNVGHLQFFCGQKLPKNTWGERCCWLHRWYCGHARIFPYDPALGARFYLSKYVVKALGEYEFIGFEQGLIFKSPIKEQQCRTQK